MTFDLYPKFIKTLYESEGKMKDQLRDVWGWPRYPGKRWLKSLYLEREKRSVVCN